MRPPPWWVRRFILAPATIVLALLFVAASPVWIVVSLLLSVILRSRFRLLRVMWLVTAYLLVETATLLVMFGMWVASGFGLRMRAPVFQRSHYRLCGAALRVLYQQACWVLRLQVQIEGVAPNAMPSSRPLLVFSRHAGPGDSFLLAHALINWYGREPRIVLKDSLQWDPAIDVLLSRLPNKFIVPGQGDRSERQIADLACDLDDDDALVIFPEGGNFTPVRWVRAIDRLRKLGFPARAWRAEHMHNVLPPRPGGVLAALSASPKANVALVAHTGVDHLLTVTDVWRELPMDKVITMYWWLESPADVPTDPDARIEWLYAWWGRIDDWISQNKVTQEIRTAAL